MDSQELTGFVGNAFPETTFTEPFLCRWARRGIIAGFGIGFTLPYLSLLNRVHVEGDEILERLPLRNVVFLANHQTYFLEAMAFFDVVYVRHGLPLERPLLRFAAAEETMNRNPLTSLMKLAGAVTLRRSFREGSQDIQRPVDLDGAARVVEAIRSGWLLHFPAGTTKRGAPLRPGVARLLHATRAVAVPVRLDGFRGLVLAKQIPGKLFENCTIRFHAPVDLSAFCAAPYTKESGGEVLARLEALIGDPA
jgi:1-acyl-sn-glycerol-3-phosphate acyltransferase